jgi:uncharacterized protein (DUF486 family)
MPKGEAMTLPAAYSPGMGLPSISMARASTSTLGPPLVPRAQLKILQEVITLSVFVPFAILYMDQPLKLDYLWAALCIMGAVYFIFRS